MSYLVRFFMIWGILDSVLLALRPHKWSRLWGNGVVIIGRKPAVAKGFAALQMVMCLYLLQKFCSSNKVGICKQQVGDSSIA
jgi:hypothetical protein